MAGSKLRFALIGCGKIAQRHGDVLFHALDDAELAAVVDLDLARAEEAASRWQCQAFDDIGSMLDATKPDVVSILTDSGSHARLALEVIPKVKNVIVEKPIALKVSDADTMIEAAAKHGTRLFVVKQVRYFKPVQKVREYFNQGRFGKLVMGSVRVRYTRTQEYYDSAPWRGTWKHDGGVIANQAIHLVDLLSWFFGEVETVYAATATRLIKMEAEDTAVATLRFKSGALATIEATVGTRPKDLEGSVSILGEKGAVELGGFAANQLLTWQFEGEDQATSQAIIDSDGTNPKSEFSYGHERYLRGVIDAIRSGQDFEVSGEVGRESLRIVDAIYASAELGRAVAMDEDFPHSRLGQ